MATEKMCDCCGQHRPKAGDWHGMGYNLCPLCELAAKNGGVVTDWLVGLLRDAQDRAQSTADAYYAAEGRATYRARQTMRDLDDARRQAAEADARAYEAEQRAKKAQAEAW